MIADHLMTILPEPVLPALWKAGRLTGWREALRENSPQTFRSELATERTTVLQEVSKKEICREGQTSIVPRFPKARSNGHDEHQSLQVSHLREQVHH
jgi:hypothetical protein